MYWPEAARAFALSAPFLRSVALRARRQARPLPVQEVNSSRDL